MINIIISISHTPLKPKSTQRRYVKYVQLMNGYATIILLEIVTVISLIDRKQALYRPVCQTFT